MIDPDVQKIADALGTSVSQLYMLSNQRIVRTKRKKTHRYTNYHKVVIHRGRGRKNRILSVPNGFLKQVQRKILTTYLYTLPVSVHAKAYQPETSVVQNALPHVGKECIAKLDISHFFDSIDTDMVYSVMRRLGLSVPATTLLTYICTYQGKLPQGAPTSPCIANLVMCRFDERIAAWCAAHEITYTRYCDDMTFSGTQAAIRNSGLIPMIQKRLYHMGFELNRDKTVIVGTSQQQRVTGVVVNEKPALSREERRRIRQEVHYCEKFGVKESLAYRKDQRTPLEYLHSLLGRIAYALQIDPDQAEMQACFEMVRGMMSEYSRETDVVSSDR